MKGQRDLHVALGKAAELFQLRCPGGRESALSLLEGSGVGPAGAGLVAVGWWLSLRAGYRPRALRDCVATAASFGAECFCYHTLRGLGAWRLVAFLDWIASYLFLFQPVRKMLGVYLRK